jgi:hypothetical protein
MQDPLILSTHWKYCPPLRCDYREDGLLSLLEHFPNCMEWEFDKHLSTASLVETAGRLNKKTRPYDESDFTKFIGTTR